MKASARKTHRRAPSAVHGLPVARGVEVLRTPAWGPAARRSPGSARDGVQEKVREEEEPQPGQRPEVHVAGRLRELVRDHAGIV